MATDTNTHFGLTSTDFDLDEQSREVYLELLNSRPTRSYKISTPDTIFVPFTTPSWVKRVDRRIRDSIRATEYKRADDREGLWLSEDVGRAALAFFRHFAVDLPGEPYLYRSKDGGLVCEVKTDDVQLSIVIYPENVAVFAVRRDDPKNPKMYMLDLNDPDLKAVIGDTSR